MSLAYWLDITECECASEHPIGGCLHCDLVDIRDELQAVRTQMDVLSKALDNVLQGTWDRTKSD